MAGIIKAGGTHCEDHHTHSAAFNFADMSNQADDYLGKVRGDAAKIIAEAKQEAQQIRAQAQQQGRQAALEAAKATIKSELQQQLQTLLPALKQVVTEISVSRDNWIRQWEGNAIRLATAIAARITRREIEKDPEISLGLIRESLQLLSGNGDITLRLNPQDHSVLADQVDLLVEEVGKLATTNVVADPRISRGGCRVESEFGIVDQQIESQLARIEEELI